MSAEDYKRMVVIPNSEYLQLKQNALPKTANSAIWPDAGSVEQEQKLYALSLKRARESDDTTARPSHADSTSIPFKFEVDTFPITYRKRAKNLAAVLEQHQVRRNEKGEVILYPNGSAIAGSHLRDLVQYATATKRRALQPTGWQAFLGKLRSINLPTSLVNIETARELKPDQVATAPARKRARREAAADAEQLAGDFWTSIS